jgi:crossover junction endodeoxyribonuclease RusA
VSGRIVHFTTYGVAAPQGSKIRNRYGGMRESSKRLQPWRADVARAAAVAMMPARVQSRVLAGYYTAGSDDVPRPLLEGGLAVRLLFVLPRPKGHYGTGRNAERLRLRAPAFPAVTPDIDKAARAVLDALTGVVMRSDAQVVTLHAEKRYGSPARCEVTVTELEERASEEAA